MSLLIAISKRDKYRMECQQYEKKYQMEVSEFEKRLHSNVNQEDYKGESDLDNWESALSSLNWWEKQIKELICEDFISYI